MSLAEAQAFIFDLDGTLLTLPVDWEKLRARLDEISGRPGVFRPIFPTIGTVVAEEPKLGPALFAAIDEFEWEAVPSARLYPGVEALLARLSERSKVSLVTMQGRRAAEKLLELYQLKQYFVGFLTREDSLDRAAQLKMALSMMRADRSTSLFVGDRLNDLNAAKKVGVPFALVRTHGDDPEDEGVPVFHSITEFASSL